MPFAFTLNGLCISFLSLSGEEVKAKTRKTADARATRARWGFSLDEKRRGTHGGEWVGCADRFSRKRVAGLHKKGASDIWSDAF